MAALDPPASARTTVVVGVAPRPRLGRNYVRRRIVVAVIDLAITAAAALVSGFVAGHWLVPVLIAFVVYRVGSEHFLGTTLGRHIAKMRLVALDDSHPALPRLLLRDLPLVAAWSTMVAGAAIGGGTGMALGASVTLCVAAAIALLDLISIGDGNGESLRDLFAGTRVVDRGHRR